MRAMTLRLVLAASLPLLVASPALPGGNASPRDGSTILVEFAQPGAGRQAVQANGDQVAGELATRTLIVKLAKGKDLDREVARYGAAPGVLYAEPNYTASIALASPNDENYAS